MYEYIISVGHEFAGVFRDNKAMTRHEVLTRAFKDRGPEALRELCDSVHVWIEVNYYDDGCPRGEKFAEMVQCGTSEHLWKTIFEPGVYKCCLECQSRKDEAYNKFKAEEKHARHVAGLDIPVVL